MSPHVLRHTAAMNLLGAGVDTTVIALWLGHESTDATQTYLHADMTIKEQAIARAAPPNTTPGRHRPPDNLLAFLEALYPDRLEPLPTAQPPSRRALGITPESA